jgi:septal ring factor EnvC (AmiA/AmiB activator)
VSYIEEQQLKIDALEAMRAKLERENAQLIDQLIRARSQLEHVLATIHDLYLGLRREQNMAASVHSDA